MCHLGTGRAPQNAVDDIPGAPNFPHDSCLDGEECPLKPHVSKMMSGGKPRLNLLCEAAVLGLYKGQVGKLFCQHVLDVFV